MPTLISHTHLQATQGDTQTKACKRVRLPNRTDRQESTGGNSMLAIAPGSALIWKFVFLL